MIAAFINANPYETFSLIVVLGALFRWWHEVAAHGAPPGFADYWLKDTPQYSAGVLLATIGAWWAVVGLELFTVPEGAAPVKWQLIVSYGAIAGYTINAAIAQGTAPAVVAVVDRAAGYLRPIMLPLLLVFALLGTAFIVTGCAGSAPVQTRNQAQALSYYTIGQGYEGIDAAFLRGDISLSTAKTLTLQVDLTRSMLDLTRNPTSKSVQDALLSTSAALSTLTINGKPAFSADKMEMVNTALAIATKATGGGPLPSSNDMAGWLLLGSDVLRAVGAATAKH